jgi:hypothetical protein
MTGGKSMTRLCTPAQWLLVPMALLLWLRPAWSAPILQQITSFFVEAPSVQFILDGQAVQTGPITASLIANSFSVFGLDTLDATSGLASLDVLLSVQFPLLNLINQPPPSIRIVESGTFSLVENTAGTFMDAELTGGGTISDGSIFDGVSYFNNEKVGGTLKCTVDVNTHEKVCVLSGLVSFATVPGTGFLSFPAALGGEQIGIVGSGTFTVAEPVGVPEPSTLALLSLGLFGLAFSVWRGSWMRDPHPDAMPLR